MSCRMSDRSAIFSRAVRPAVSCDIVVRQQYDYSRRPGKHSRRHLGAEPVLAVDIAGEFDVCVAAHAMHDFLSHFTDIWQRMEFIQADRRDFPAAGPYGLLNQ